MIHETEFTRFRGNDSFDRDDFQPRGRGIRGSGFDTRNSQLPQNDEKIQRQEQFAKKRKKGKRSVDFQDTGDLFLEESSPVQFIDLEATTVHVVPGISEEIRRDAPDIGSQVQDDAPLPIPRRAQRLFQQHASTKMEDLAKKLPASHQEEITPSDKPVFPSQELSRREKRQLLKQPEIADNGDTTPMRIVFEKEVADLSSIQRVDTKSDRYAIPMSVQRESEEPDMLQFIPREIELTPNEYEKAKRRAEKLGKSWESFRKSGQKSRNKREELEAEMDYLKNTLRNVPVDQGAWIVESLQKGFGTPPNEPVNEEKYAYVRKRMIEKPEIYTYFLRSEKTKAVASHRASYCMDVFVQLSSYSTEQVNAMYAHIEEQRRAAPQAQSNFQRILIDWIRHESNAV